MAAFTFTSPEGKSYTVEGPDGATQQQAFGILQQQLGSPQQNSAPAAAAQAPQGSWLSRQPGIIGRALATGVAGLGDMFANVGSADLPIPQGNDFSQATAGALNRAGVSAPQNTGERLESAAIGSLSAGAIMGPAAILPTMAGGVAGQAVTENGGNDFGAMLASLLAGGVAGGVQGGVRGAIESQATSPAPGSRAAAVQTLADNGVNVNVAQATGNKIARHIDRASQMVTRGAEEYAGEQQKDFNDAVLAHAGAPAGSQAATADVLGPTRERIVAGMDAIEARSGADFDTNMAGDIQAVQRSLARTTADSERGPVLQNIQDMMTAASENGGTIPGPMVRQIKGNLQALAANHATAVPAQNLLEALQNSVQRSSSPADVAEYSTLRGQYRALSQIEAAADPTTGNITPARLMQVLGQQKYRRQTLYDQSDTSLAALSKAAKQVLPDTLGNSGTPERFIPTLTLMEDVQAGHPITAALKTGLGLTGVGFAARALRNPSVVNALTSNRLADAAGGATSGAGAGAVYGAAGNAADEFLRHLDWIEGRRQQAQIQ